MKINSKKSAVGYMDEICCDEPSYLIWKWHPAGMRAGESKRENAIRFGSSLRVKDGEVAVFVYHQYDETLQDFIVGPYDQIIETANLPVLASIVGLAYGGGTPFQAEIYFINLANIIQVKFGVPFFDVYDPRFPDFGVPLAVRGTISFRIADYREFISLHRLRTFDLSDFQAQIKSAVCRYVKDVVANAPAAHNIPLVQIETKTAQINDAIEYDIGKRLREDFGVEVSGVDISAIELDKTSDGYRQLMRVTRDIALGTAQAEAENYAETLRIQREENQYAQRKQTQSAHMAAYQIEKQAEVGVAGASALGQMGSNGDAFSGGFNPAAIMAGMTVGNAVGQNIAGAMNNLMYNTHQIPKPATPPPIVQTLYHVAVNGQATGPYDFTALAQLAANGTLTKNTLVWTQGMANWVLAGNVQELQALFPSTSMPLIPPIQGA